MKLTILIILLCVPSAIYCDEHHYKDVLIGERAAGLGGSFAAISDDPSGLYHNPAGIVFGLENYLSLSTNAYTSTQQRFKDIYPGQDYTYRSQELFPVFFGFTQSRGRDKFGFCVITQNADLFDQDDSVSSPTKSFTRKFFLQNTTYLFGPAYAMELSDNLAVGVTLFGIYQILKTIDNTQVLYDPSGNGKYYLFMRHAARTSFGVIPKIGVQYMPTAKWSMGLTVTKPFNWGGSGVLKVTQSKVGDDGNPVPPSGTYNNDISLQETTNVFHEFPEVLTVSLGNAYFFSKRFLITAQVDAYEGIDSYLNFPIRATLNYSLGLEYYVADWFAVRSAFYTNNANTHPIDPSDKNQAPHVNLLGTTLGLSLYRPSSSVTLTINYASGTGQGQAISNSTNVQDVQQGQLGFYFSGSYQL